MPSSKGKRKSVPVKKAAPAAKPKKVPTCKEDFIQKGAKLPKDEKAPSAKTSAYMYFSKAQRAKMAKKPESQQLDFTSAGTAIGKAWTALTDKQKVPFENQAKDDADRYDAEMKKYKPSAKFTAELEACKKNPKYQQKLKKDPAAPSKAQSAYLFYTSEARVKLAKQKAHEEKTMTELSVVMGKQWGGMSDANKSKYVAMAEEDKARYEREMKKYKPTKLWLEAKEYLDEKKAKAKAKTPEAIAAKQAAKDREAAKAIKEKQTKSASLHKAAQAAHSKAEKESAKAAEAEKKALAKVAALEAKMAGHDKELKALGVKPKPKAKTTKTKAPKAEVPVGIVEAVSVEAGKRKAKPAAKKAKKSKKK